MLFTVIVEIVNPEVMMMMMMMTRVVVVVMMNNNDGGYKGRVQKPESQESSVRGGGVPP